jgi:hypothetical protein
MGCGGTKAKNEHHPIGNPIIEPIKPDTINQLYMKQEEGTEDNPKYTEEYKVTESNKGDKERVETETNKSRATSSVIRITHHSNLLEEQDNNIVYIEELRPPEKVTSQIKFKIEELVVLIIGDKQSGKTSIFNRLVYKKYNDDYQSTEAIKVIAKDVNIDKCPHRIRFIDTPELNTWEDLSDYIVQANVVIYVYDCSGRFSYNP